MGETDPSAVAVIDPERYRSYLLRLWRESPGAAWRAQVRCVQSSRERRFAGLADLFEFLEQETSDVGDALPILPGGPCLPGG